MSVKGKNDAGATAPAFAAALALLHRELGIPADYAITRGLLPVAEASDSDLRTIATSPKEVRLLSPAAEAWSRLAASAAAANVILEPVSGFRSVSYQAEIFRRKLQRGIVLAEILAVNFAPGYSEHHSGRAVDIATAGEPPLEESFAHTRAFAWLSEHARGFGFFLSYPAGNSVGLHFEPWHWLWEG